MDRIIKGGLICFGLGMVLGAVVVSKNKKLADGIDDATDNLANKFEDAKEMIEDKIQDFKEYSQNKNQVKKQKNTANNKK